MLDLEQVVHQIVKPPRAWKNTPAEKLPDLDALTERRVFFSGTARQAADAYSQNANATVVTSLAGIGLDKTWAEMVADPASSVNGHRIDARGAFGNMKIQLESNPLATNPEILRIDGAQPRPSDRTARQCSRRVGLTIMDRIQPEIPADLRALMAEIGPKGAPRGHIKLTVDRFTAVHKRRPADDLRITGDITYGDHPRQMFNVYVPKIDRQDRASLLFVQGGAFFDGHRIRNEEIYSCRAIRPQRCRRHQYRLSPLGRRQISPCDGRRGQGRRLDAR